MCKKQYKAAKSYKRGQKNCTKKSKKEEDEAVVKVPLTQPYG